MNKETQDNTELETIYQTIKSIAPNLNETALIKVTNWHDKALATQKSTLIDKFLESLPEEKKVEVDEPDDEVFNEAIGFNRALTKIKALAEKLRGTE